MRFWLKLALPMFMFLAACAHSGGSERIYRTKPVCDGVTRLDKFELYRAVFLEELSVNEVEAIQELEEQYLLYSGLQLHYPESKTEGEVTKYKRSRVGKEQALEKLVTTYSQYLGSESPSVVLMSLYRSGEAHEQLALAIENTRVPEGSTQTQKDAFCSDLLNSTAGTREAAKIYYKRCVDESARLGVDNIWTKQCASKL